MKTSRLISSSWTFPLAVAVVYTLWTLADLPSPHYLPETRSLVWHAPAGTIAMAWYGRTVLALVLGAGLGLLGALALGPTPRRWGPPLAALVVIACLALLAVREVHEWVLREPAVIALDTQGGSSGV